MYFDSAATTPLDQRVKNAMIDVMDVFGNENSKHCYGFESRKAIDTSLAKIAKILKVSPDQIFITYSGTDANRRAITSSAKRFGNENLYCSAVEHSSISDEILKQNTFDPRGKNWEKLQEKNPKFLALMHANSETGAIYDGKMLREMFPKAFILRDYAQSFAKGILPDFENCDFGTFAPSKFYGPKMIGLIYLKNPENFPEISKDSHTKNVYQIVGMSKSFEIWNQEKEVNQKKLKKWQTQIEDFITQNIPDYKIHEKNNPRVTGLFSVAFKGIRGGELMTILSNEEGIGISTGAACTSDILSATRILKYIEHDHTWQFPIRIGLHKFLTDKMVTDFCEILAHYIKEIRKQGSSR
ncbi:aminotransferase class V-fold PLP-dependent enzyme [Candidatus Gracilibacteria bacterium]|nr:aminotransferase class V-fold PLP-dependent enzyme [Candidatus Gracilibacteria bacterium]